MPVYVYRAVTDKGLVVKNKIEEASKQALVKRLKNNGITRHDNKITANLHAVKESLIILSRLPCPSL